MRGWDNPIYHRDPLCLFKFDGTFTGNPLICASWFLGCVQIFLYIKKNLQHSTFPGFRATHLQSSNHPSTSNRKKNNTPRMSSNETQDLSLGSVHLRIFPPPGCTGAKELRRTSLCPKTKDTALTAKADRTPSGHMDVHMAIVRPGARFECSGAVQRLNLFNHQMGNWTFTMKIWGYFIMSCGNSITNWGISAWTGKFTIKWQILEAQPPHAELQSPDSSHTRSSQFQKVLCSFICVQSSYAKMIKHAYESYEAALLKNWFLIGSTFLNVWHTEPCLTCPTKQPPIPWTASWSFPPYPPSATASDPDFQTTPSRHIKMDCYGLLFRLEMLI